MQGNMFMECLTLNGKINIKNNYFSFNLEITQQNYMAYGLYLIDVLKFHPMHL